MPPKRGGYVPKKAIAPPTAVSTKPPPKFPPLPHLPKAKEPTLMEKYAVAAAAELRASYRAAPYYLKLPVVKQMDVERYSTRYAAKDEPSSALAAVQTDLSTFPEELRTATSNDKRVRPAGSTAKGTVRFQPLLTANWEQLQELERQEQERGEEQDEDGVKREKKGEEDEDNEEEEEEEDLDEDEENDYTTNFYDEGDDYGAADDEPDEPTY